jgi:hypothetical protein
MPFTCSLSALVLAKKGYLGGCIDLFVIPTSARLVITVDHGLETILQELFFVLQRRKASAAAAGFGEEAFNPELQCMAGDTVCPCARKEGDRSLENIWKNTDGKHSPDLF